MESQVLVLKNVDSGKIIETSMVDDEIKLHKETKRLESKAKRRQTTGENVVLIHMKKLFGGKGNVAESLS